MYIILARVSVAHCINPGARCAIFNRPLRLYELKPRCKPRHTVGSRLSSVSQCTTVEARKTDGRTQEDALYLIGGKILAQRLEHGKLVIKDCRLCPRITGVL